MISFRKKFKKKNLFLRIIFTFTIFLFFIKLINSDVISVNAGGSNEFIVSSNKFIEGFFFGGICGDGILDPSLGEQCDDGNTVSGDGCSSICQIEVVTPPPTGEIPSPPGEAVPTANIAVSPSQFNINMIVNTTTERTIKVTNLGATTITVFVNQQNLDNRVILPQTNLTLLPGETKDLRVIFVALSEPGIFTGTINIDGKQVLVSLNVKTAFLLFDSNIVVLNKDFTVIQGEELQTLVTLIPIGDPQRLDVTLNFVIKDYSKKIFLTKSETLMVDKQVQLRRNFDTGLLPPGNYIVGLELIYPNGVAPSSAYFKVIEKPKKPFVGKILFILIILIVILIILIIIIIIIRRRREEETEEQEQQIINQT
jgi:cysteine-rich repeat protein